MSRPLDNLHETSTANSDLDASRVPRSQSFHQYDASDFAQFEALLKVNSPVHHHTPAEEMWAVLAAKQMFYDAQLEEKTPPPPTPVPAQENEEQKSRAPGSSRKTSTSSKLRQKKKGPHRKVLLSPTGQSASSPEPKAASSVIVSSLSGVEAVDKKNCRLCGGSSLAVPWSETEVYTRRMDESRRTQLNVQAWAKGLMSHMAPIPMYK